MFVSSFLPGILPFPLWYFFFRVVDGITPRSQLGYERRIGNSIKVEQEKAVLYQQRMLMEGINQSIIIDNSNCYFKNSSVPDKVGILVRPFKAQHEQNRYVVRNSQQLRNSIEKNG